MIPLLQPHVPWHEGMWWGFPMVMGLFWVIVLVVVIVAALRLIQRDDRGADRSHRPSPMEILQRRYAEGDISTEEYEERKKHIE